MDWFHGLGYYGISDKWELGALRSICIGSFSFLTLFFRWRMGNAQEWNMLWLLTFNTTQLLDLHD